MSVARALQRAFEEQKARDYALSSHGDGDHPPGDESGVQCQAESQEPRTDLQFRT